MKWMRRDKTPTKWEKYINELERELTWWKEKALNFKKNHQ